LVLAALFFITSCKKEPGQVTPPTLSSNKPPVANAGPDQTTVLPKDSALLDGSASTDPDGTLTSYKWAKISGPVSSTIINATSSKTTVKSLVAGVYQFDLTVTDNGGRSAKDTVQITVATGSTAVVGCDNSNRPIVNAQLTQVGTLSQARSGMAVASAGNKILFAGGTISANNYIRSSKIDIYDLTTQTWSTAELSIARSYIAAVSSGNKIFFGGGETGDGTSPINTVDIYDVSTNIWSKTALSLAGHSIAAAAVGNKVFFAGGSEFIADNWDRSRRVDIYNMETNTWSIASLSGIKRGGHSAVTVNNKIYFSGGETWPANPVPGTYFASNTIDIFDNATNSWSASTMMQGKLNHASIAVGDKIYWGGGATGSFPSITSTCSVEIKDVNTGNSTIQNLFAPGQWSIDGGQNAVVKDNKIILYSSSGRDADKFNIYDIASNTWSIGVLPVKIEEASIISVNNTIYMAGGYVNGVLSNKVWKLEF
jgi:N-acetylneuraminic acid mutarotase